MRVALHTTVRGDRIGEYERAHAAVPAGLTDAIRAAGVTGWTIWRSGTDLFHVIDCADYDAMLAALNAQPGERRMAGPHGGTARHAARLLGGRRRRRAAGCLAAMTVIDAHHHVWDLAVRDQPWLSGAGMAAIRRTFTVDDLRPAARAAGVGATVLVQTVTVAAETPEMLALADADPLVAAVVGWTDLTSPAIADELARLAGGPGGGRLVGIRHQVQEEPDPDWLRRPDVIRGLRAVAAAGLAYDLVILPHQLPAATYAAAAVPGLTLVLDHAGKPDVGGDLSGWTTAVRDFAARPNTTCKLSGLATEAPGGAAVAGGSRGGRRRARRVRRRPGHVRLRLAGLPARQRLRRRDGPGQVADRRAVAGRTGGGIRRDGGPRLPARRDRPGRRGGHGGRRRTGRRARERGRGSGERPWH